MQRNQSTKLVSNLGFLSDRGNEPEVRRLKENGLYEVQSFKNPSVFYVVDLIAKSCTCPHFTYRGVRCKHIKAVEETLNGSRKLLQSYYASKKFADAERWENDLRRIGLL